jgi:hypothetical protein
MGVHLSREDAKRFGIEAGSLSKPHKYGAKATIYNGVKYPSKAQARRAEELDLEMKAGSVAWWIGEPVFRLGVSENVYRADFLVVWPLEKTVFAGFGIHVEDVKGKETQKFQRDKKLWARYGPCQLHILGRDSVEIIGPGVESWAAL